MSYNIFHYISTTILENNSVLDCVESYLKDENIFTKEEILLMIDSARKQNEKLHQKSIIVIDELKREII